MFRRKSTFEIQNMEEAEIIQTVEISRNDRIPKFQFRKLCNIGTLSTDMSHRFKHIEMTIAQTKEQTDSFLITKECIRDAKSQGYKFMHIGAIQVAFKLNACRDTGAAMIAVLRDNRMNDFSQSLLGAVQADLNSQIAYFNVLPDYTTSLDDAVNSLRLTIKTHNLKAKENIKIISVEYQDRYHTFSSKKIAWNDIEFPMEWKLEGTKRMQESSEPTHIYEDYNGGMSLRFGETKFFEGETSGHTKSDFEDLFKWLDLKVLKSQSKVSLEQEFYSTTDPERLLTVSETERLLPFEGTGESGMTVTAGNQWTNDQLHEYWPCLSKVLPKLRGITLSAQDGEIVSAGYGMVRTDIQTATGNFQERTLGTVQILTPVLATPQPSDKPEPSKSDNSTTMNYEKMESDTARTDEDVMTPVDLEKDVDPLEKFLPPPSKIKCSEDLQERINKFLALNKRDGKSFNAAVRKKKEYRNPDFLLHAVRYQDIDQIGSCFSKDVFDPHGYEKCDYYDEIGEHHFFCGLALISLL
ncbi:hypothetical protein GIB67_014679 [Kingdonia uniflora]|uniref:Uncharacterized protein n=1 Tax=Kingdonia uniflora TaxID=39325 RepID=A0A7J7LYD9_9MAGN|nr:hypothetical protein GIB67_014679 [Kingdonia uniflora]